MTVSTQEKIVFTTQTVMKISVQNVTLVIQIKQIYDRQEDREEYGYVN